MRALVATVLLLSAALARAGDLSIDADRELAQRNYRAGLASYELGDYEAALAAFARARASYPAAALDYNVGRCLDRLDRPQEAIAEYQRFLDRAPGDLAAADVRERIRVLRERIAALEAERLARARALTGGALSAPRPVYRRWWVWTTVVLVAAAAGAGATLGVLLSRPTTPTVATDYGTIRFP